MTLNTSNDSQSAVLGAALKHFKSATRNPEVYLQVQTKKAQKYSELVKQLYDHAKTAASNRSSHLPDEIVVEHMDEEQIWQQVELQNEFLWSRCLKVSGKLLSGKDEAFRLNYKVVGEEDDVDEEEDEEDEEEVDEEEATDDEDGSELGSDDDDEDAEEEDDDDDVDNSASRVTKKPGRKSIVDDKFFKLSEMEEFLEAEDRKEMQKHSQKRRKDDDDDDDIDYFKESDGESGDDDENYNYSDFFDGEKPSRRNAKADDADDDDDGEDERTRFLKALEKKNRTKLKAKKEDLGLEDSDIDEEADDDEDDGVEEEESGDEDGDEAKSGKVKFDLSKNKYRSDSDRSDDDDDKPPATGANDVDDDDDTAERSTHEHRQERLRLRIQDMEEQVMGEKSWQLRGEINSDNRPQNSLLEEVLEFDSTVRPAPVITEETTLRLEDIIRQRIKDKAWNDVERKFKPTSTPQEFRKKLVLDQEKSKESLAQIYEKEYLKEVDKLAPASGAADDKETADEPKEHTEIRSLMKELFGKLDALGNFFYTPKVAQADVRIITNIAAINMEEVAPVAISDAALLAPEEVRPRDKGDAVGKSERTQTDKNRERRQKKQKQREAAQRKERKEAEMAAKGVVSSSKEEKKKLLAKVSKGRNVLKMKESNDGKSIKSSRQFFSQLQDEVATASSGVKTKSKGKRKQVDANQANAKKFKI